MSWTDERVETLKKMWGEGQSASQIAKELGGVTRNAVIGKVHRLGLSNRVGASAEGATAPAAGIATKAPAHAPLGDDEIDDEAAPRGEPLVAPTAAPRAEVPAVSLVLPMRKAI
ncbi:MAG: GcrA family cell cycle regulator, partial [Pseudorhodobacter sp.]|nr:GcrA family cell cycle regulator [Pseudorhodobacter sp.]